MKRGTKSETTSASTIANKDKQIHHLCNALRLAIEELEEMPSFGQRPRERVVLDALRAMLRKKGDVEGTPIK